MPLQQSLLKLSICIATYNGTSFIGEQIKSVLPYIGPEDEIILCDDASQDGTVELVRTLFSDTRIKVFSELGNVGHVKNFERAIKFATGDIILLCDQDDIWKEHKIRYVREMFADPELLMLYHDFDILYRGNIRETNSLGIDGRYYYSGLSFLTNKLKKMDVWGCTIAFRKQLRVALLPFPSTVFAHDHYISVTASFYGKVFAAPEVLLTRRLHDSNLTTKSGRLSFRRVKNIAKTISMCMSIIIRKLKLRKI